MRPLSNYVNAEVLGAFARLEFRIQICGASPDPVSTAGPSDFLGVKFRCITTFGGALNYGCACQGQVAIAGAVRSLTNIACICCGKRRCFARINHQLKLSFEWGNLCQSRSRLGFHHVVLVSWQCDCSQNTDDRHNDHQFDQGETLLHGTDSTVHNTSPQSSCNESWRGISPGFGKGFSRFHANQFLQRLVASLYDFSHSSRAERLLGGRGVTLLSLCLALSRVKDWG